MIGKTLDGRYRILSLLGEGGMGKVYLAEHVVLEKRMAVKVLHEEYSRQEEVVKRFQQEAIAASRIGQENIVNVTDFGRTPEGALFFVMEELEGESLAALLRKEGVLSAQRALPILAQVCRALAAAHSRGIVHRDLKPENVIILQREDRADFVKVLDFGISKVGTAETNQQKLTRVGVIMGTPEYMAPEQAAGNAVDHRVDIYSLGVMTYELFTGAIPFNGDNPLAILMKHQGEVPVPPRQLRPDLGIPANVEALILKALAKSPDARHQYMSEVMADLSACLVSLGMAPLSFSRETGTRAMPPGRTANGAQAKRQPSGTLQLGEALAPPPAKKKPSGTLQLEGDPAPAVAPVPLRRLTPSGTQSQPGPRRAPSPELTPEEVAAVGGGRRRTFWAALLLVGIAVALEIFQPWKTHPAGAPQPLAGSLHEAPAPVAPRPVPPEAPASLPSVATAPPPAVEPPASPPPAAVPVRAKLHRVTLASEPAGATVFEGRTRVGVAPLEVELREDQSPVYRFSLLGYRPESRRVASSDTEVRVMLSKGTSHRRTGGSKASSNSFEEDLKDDPFK